MSEFPDPKLLAAVAGTVRARAAALTALAKSAANPSSAAVEKALAKLDENEPVELDAILAQVRSWLTEQEQSRRRRLNAELRAACQQAELELLVLAREPLELRLPPISVLVDYERNRAELRFADGVLQRCEVEAGAIMQARKKALDQLEGRHWDAPAFLELLLKAWRRVARGAGGWVELVDVLPELTLLRQDKKFRRDPSARNFKPYPRVCFAYDLWRLRRDRCLSHDGWRLTLGTATGGSTRDKSRVLRLEDERGQGQYHLSLRFVREEASHDPS